MSVAANPLCILIAPDSFKGTYSAQFAAQEIARGVKNAARDAALMIEVDICPLADGGEGTLEVIAQAIGADIQDFEVLDLLGRPTTAHCATWINSDGTCTILVESAQVIGLPRIPVEKRHPLQLSTFALGELVRSIDVSACRLFVLALGGSATVDGGIGMAAALGVQFLDATGHALANPCAEEVKHITRIVPARLQTPEIVALCDVDNPLLGPNGAAAIFGPQKGATPEDVIEIEANLNHLLRVCQRSHLAVDAAAAGAGAAGGLGFGCATFLGARCVSGSAYVMDLVGVADRLDRADLVITGERRLDAQSSLGKITGQVARASGNQGLPVLVVCGSASPDPHSTRKHLAGVGISIAHIETLDAHHGDIAQAAARAVSDFLC